LPPVKATGAGALQSLVTRHVATPLPRRTPMPSAKLAREGTTTIQRASGKTCFGLGRSGAVINWPRTAADASRRSRLSASCFCAPNERLANAKRTNSRLTRYLGSERELDFIDCLHS